MKKERAIRLFDMLEKKTDYKAIKRIRYVLAVGESFSDNKADAIEKKYNVKIITAYGTTETNTLALPCKENHLHLNSERYYFELLSLGNSLFELIVTLLENEAFPLIRYKTEDVVEVLNSDCKLNENKVIKHHGRLEELLNINNVIYSKVQLEKILFEIYDSRNLGIRQVKYGVPFLLSVKDSEKKILSKFLVKLKSNMKFVMLMKKWLE